MNESKSPLTSVTVGGIVVMLLPIVLNFFGVQLSPEESAEGSQLIERGTSVIELAVGLAGAVIAFVGRMRARKRMTLTGK